METPQQRIDSEQQATLEIIEDTEPRFLDLLTPEQEQDWQDLLELTSKPAQHIDNLRTITIDQRAMLKIWNNPQIKQAFRDRAFLTVISEPFRCHLGDPGFNSQLGPWGDFDYEKMRRFSPSMSAEELNDWMDDIAQYDLDNEEGYRLIDHRFYLDWGIKRFGYGEMTEDAFIDLLDKLDFPAAMPTHIGEVVLFDENPDVETLRTDVLPIVFYALRDNTLLSHWSLDILSRWIDHQSGNNTQRLPKFMLEASEKQVIESYCALLAGKYRNFDLYQEQIAKAVTHFGWPAIIQTMWTSYFESDQRWFPDSAPVALERIESFLLKKSNVRDVPYFLREIAREIVLNREQFEGIIDSAEDLEHETRHPYIFTKNGIQTVKKIFGWPDNGEILYGLAEDISFHERRHASQEAIRVTHRSHSKESEAEGPEIRRSQEKEYKDKLADIQSRISAN